MAKVLEFCNEISMDINLQKTSFFIINGGGADHEHLVFSDLKIPYKSTYCYLGSFFTDDGKMSSAIKMHIKSKTADINKFTIFVLLIRQSLFTLKSRYSTVV